MPAKTKNKKRLLDAADICRIKTMTACVMSPDENRIAYTVETISDDKQKYYSHLYVYDLKARQSKRYTFGEIHDSAPVWSPDGKQLAFTSTRDKKSGIYLMPVEGGAERRLLELDGAVSGLHWTPDGKSLVYMFRYNDSHRETDEKKKSEPPLFRHINRLFYRWDGAGWNPKDHFHIYRLDIDRDKPVQLTKGNYDDLMPSVSPDGKWVVYMSNHSRNPDLDSLFEDLFIVSVNGGQPRRVPTPAGPKMIPTFSPNGKKIAYLGHDKPASDWGSTNFHVWTVGVDGRPKAIDLIKKFDRPAFDMTAGDLCEGHQSAPLYWSPDGKRVYFTASDTGSTHLFYVSSMGGLPTRVTHRPCHVKGYTMAGRMRNLATITSDLKNPGDLFILPPQFKGDAKAEQLTDINRELFAQIDMPTTKEVWFKAHDGFELQGWLVTPPRFNRNRRYPAILEIHGGPRVQYGFTFFHEMNYLASKGYVVFYTNPRGGSGRGESFAAAISGGWGEIDYYDCMSATDYLEKRPFVNGKRLAVTGGSYGGYMTNWIVGHTNRFRAAVTQRSVVNLESFLGSSDIGYMLYREFDGHPWQNPETYHKCSPLTYAKNIKTPLLIIHSEQDLRCGIEQAQQLFTTLKLMRKTVEMVVFPGEPHGLSRHGRPDRRVARLEWIVKWFDRYVK
ncbi:MAG: S9 family peptidase [candidate division Zixibacteria bacterium]|nr:S9 family peptidase [candidate division Zixibacteria bacterium]